MGADTTSTQLIFFIAATVVATAAAGIMAGIVTDLTGKAEIRGKAFGDSIASEITIINDPNSIVTSPDTLFYVKNTGNTELDWGNMTVILDGQILTSPTISFSLLSGETTFRPGAIVQVTRAGSVASGDHDLKVVMENGVSDTLRFRI